MKILHTSEFYTPSPGGIQEAVKQISERLARKGHEVTIATSRMDERKEECIGGVKVVEFTVSGNLVRGIEGNSEEYLNFVLEGNFDIVTNFAAQEWATDLLIPHLGGVRGKKVFVPTGFSALFNRAYRDYYESMGRWIKGYDMVVFLSNTYRDIRWAQKRGVMRTVVIPNGASEEEFLEKKDLDFRCTRGIGNSGFFILHVGSHTGEKGHREAIDIFRMADIDDSVLVIAGNGGVCGDLCREKEDALNSSKEFRKKRKKILNLELTREETVAAFQEADLFLFPSNVECSPIVLFECMASKTPFLTTDVGNASEIITWSGGGLLLPTVKKEEGYGSLSALFKSCVNGGGHGECRRVYSLLRRGCSIAKVDESARLLRKLYDSPQRRIELGEAGYSSWREKFTWEHVAERYEDLYRSLLEERVCVSCEGGK